MDQLQFNLQPERRIYTVSDLTARIRDLLFKNFTDITCREKFRTADRPRQDTSTSR